MPSADIKICVKNYTFKEPSLGVQRFYNAQCADIKIDNLEHIDEIIAVLKEAKNFEIKRLR